MYGQKAMYGYGGAPLAPRPGAALSADDPANKYIVIKYISKGSFGVARLVERKSDRAQLISKEVKLANMKPADRESAKNEVSMLRNMNHPNITRYVDHYESAGSLFIVMEFANGGDLMTKIQSRRGIRFTEKEVMSYFCQISLALLYLHEKRVLHRDLKTQNVFLTRDGVVKLGDFGISTVLRNTFELKKTVCGTPYYFSPELCLSKPYGNKSDVWALGCILYELASLTHAFEGNNMKALVQKILKGIYPPVHSSYSKDLSSLIACMLRLDPSKRPNMHEIIQMPYVREHLAALQATAALANQDKRSLVDPAEKLRQQQDALRRVEEEKKLKAKRDAEAKARNEAKEREHQQRVDHIRQQMAAEVQQHEDKLKRVKEQQVQAARDQQANEERRRLELIDKLRRQEADAKRAEEERKGRELERQKRAAEERTRIEADRKRWEEEKKKQDEERKARMARDMAQHKKREAEWEQNMKALKQQPASESLPDGPLPPAHGADGKSLDDQARLAAWKEMRQQAAANKRKVDEVEKGPARVSPVEPPVVARKSPPVSAAAAAKQQPASSADPGANRDAFMAMRREAEENRRRSAAIEVGQRPANNNNNKDGAPLPNRPPPQPTAAQGGGQQQQQQPVSALNTPANSIDDQTRREVYFQMRREAEANRRRLLGQEGPAPAEAPPQAGDARKPSPPKPQQQPQAAVVPLAEMKPPLPVVSPATPADDKKEDIVLSESDDDDDDGQAGLHRFLNADAMVEEDDESAGEEDGDKKAAEEAAAAAAGAGGDADAVEQDDDALLSPSKAKHTRRQDYADVTSFIADALDASKHQTAPEDFADDIENGIDPFKFMVDGKELQLHGVQQDDPLGHRIESLRVFLEECFDNCGDLDFLRVYRTLGKIELIESEEESEKQLATLRKNLPEKQRQLYLPLVTQLIVCEDVFNMQHNHG